MNVKAIAIAAAAAAAATSASAADLPVVAEPVDYVQVCDAFGAGYFFIPGTDTCLKISGETEVEAEWTNTAAELEDLTVTADSEVVFDAKTQSEFALIETSISFSYGYTNARAADEGSVSGGDSYITISNDMGALSMGYGGSIFGPYWDAEDGLYISYSKSLGNGVTAAVALQESEMAYSAAGTSEWDVIGTVGITQGWGSVDFAAAYHVVQEEVAGGDEESGYAIAADASIDLGMNGATLDLSGILYDQAFGYTGEDSDTSAHDLAGRHGYELDAAVSFDLSDALSADLSAGYDAWDYDNPLLVTDIEDSKVSFGAGLAYAASDELDLGVTADWGKLDSDADAEVDFGATATWTPASVMTFAAEAEWDNVTDANNGEMESTYTFTATYAF
ncbi:hypothetical protein E1162_09165 [Rhodobacteraceae bacterium RKSG542]|uniref:porin n=1 Tax=Pseudovibrio flavus TaxID=2529854 RepID=UPI0012BCDB3B|nr:porin [Pseudovibrio flavus]MTI17411.1 hypothetical protein [Pseudovibrio flavus]